MNEGDEQKKRELSRQEFMKFSVAALAGVSGIVMGIPLVSALIGPALQKSKQNYAKVTDVASLQSGTPEDLNFAVVTEDAFIKSTDLHNIWAVKNSGNDVTVFSPICPHLGCRYTWQADSQHFVCPCHGSVFSKDGKVLGGPAPRPLDTLPTKIENGELYVEWEMFKEGIPQKEAI